MKKDRLAPPPDARSWTRVEDYVAALARRRTARRKHAPQQPRTEPEAPRFALSTLPFLALIGALLVLAAAIIVAAWPVGQSPPQRQAEDRELGTAPKGWFQEAEKEFRNRS